MKVSRPRSAATADSAGSTPHGTADHGLRPGFEGLRDLMDRLLGPDGCPWDREQSLETLRPYLLEEAHEVLEAMDDPEHHRQELGDLLFQIVFQSALREREGAFDLDGVVEAIRTKMIRRHPHVFDAARAGKRPSAREVEQAWERIKRTEREAADLGDPITTVPRGLPAVQRAWRLQEKAAAIGFDWPDAEGALGKLREELAELEQARGEGDRAAMQDELGDVFFVLVRVAQKLGIDPEQALGGANAKFERRFAHVLRRCRETGVAPENAGLQQLDAWWNEAKAEETVSRPRAHS